MSAKEAEEPKSGEKILQLLAIIDKEPMVERVQKLYKSAYEQRLSDPRRALEDCQKALEEIGLSSRTVFDNSMTFAYTRGKFYLLMASIHLNAATVTSWQEAEKNYRLSREEFRPRAWSHLAGLASLGLAMARRQMGKFEEAMNACSEAQKNLEQESIPSFINTRTLRAAIEEECSLIQETRKRFARASWLPEKVLSVFYVLTGEGRIAGRRSAELNLLSRADYERYTVSPVEEVIIDLIKYPRAQNADYILEIDAHAKTEGDLKPGDWLFIQTHSTPNRLHGKTVTVLVDEGQGTTVGLRTCIKAEGHYFLKAKDTTSIIIITSHETILWEIPNFEALYGGEKKIITRPDAVPVSGAVIDNGRTLRQAQSKTTGAFIWRIPQINHISAGLGNPIAEQNIEAYVNLREQKSIEGANYFVLVVDGDSMTGDGIFAGDKVLIRQQEGANNKDIAAVVINTPMTDPVGVLKRYYVVSEEDEAMRHWLLESSNLSSENLVVIPDGANIKAIRAMYRKVSDRKFEFYEQAELTIAGVYIKVVERA